MTERSDNPFNVRPGRIRSGGSSKRARSYLSRVAQAVNKAGPPGRRSRGQSASYRSRPARRRVIVKTHIVRMSVSSIGALAAHLAYIKRDSALSGADRGQLFSPESETTNTNSFAAKIGEDRHHFRFIVSPEDGAQMQDLKPFVRDLMQRMEQDLSTPLNWVSAVHHDTGRPHAHIVLRGKRDDGSDLVIPKAYVSHTMRERAEDLVTLELGPETQLETDRKLAHEVGAERFTRIDRHLSRTSDAEGIVSLEKSGRYRQIHSARLRALGKLGLASKLSASHWQIEPRAEETLRALGTRRDIIKTMNKALVGRTGRRVDNSSLFNRSDPNGNEVIGEVIASGLTGEAHDTAYAVIDTMEGRAVYAELGGAEQLEDVKRGVIVRLSPPVVAARASDRMIDQIAKKSGGVYSAALHQAADPKARPEFVTAHIRRLEAMRRAGFAMRASDGTWQISEDHLARVETYERARVRRSPLKSEILSHWKLADQPTAMGATWLDDFEPTTGPQFGWAAEVAAAKQKRQQFLVETGVIELAKDRVTVNIQAKLLTADLRAAGEGLRGEIGKAYAEAPARGEIEGVYRNAVIRPSGKFAVIERAREFTLVPWRSVLERSRGKSVSGVFREGEISWKANKVLTREY